MEVKDAHRSNVLVQTQGNIVVNVEREPARLSAVRLFLVRSRPVFIGSTLVTLLGVGLAAQAHFVEKRELRSARQIDRLEAQVAALSAAFTQQASHVDHMVEKVDRIENDVAALPALVETTVQRSTSSVVDAISNLELKPSFQNLYVAGSGFQSDVENAPAKLQTASAMRPNEVEPRRRRPSSFRRTLSHHDAVVPSNALSSAPGQEEATPVPTSEP